MSKKKVLVVGRTWKFVEFLIPTLHSLWHQQEISDIIVLENKSSRYDSILRYCSQLLKDKRILRFYDCDENYFSNIWRLLSHYSIKKLISDYEYVSLTDFDMSLKINKTLWLNDLTDILEHNSQVGAVSVDFEPMLPYSNGFIHTTDVPESNIKGFYQMPTDGWYYTVRSSELLKFLDAGGLGPGMHGYNDWIHGQGKITGRIPLQFYHHGWLRLHPEYKEAYKETGIDFKLDTQYKDNSNYIRIQEQTFLEVKAMAMYQLCVPERIIVK